MYKIEEDIRDVIYKQEIYDFVSSSIQFYKNKVVDKDLGYNRIGRLSSDGLTIYFLTNGSLFNIPIDWICLAYKLKDRIVNWEPTVYPIDYTCFNEMFSICKFIIKYLSKDQIDKLDLKEKMTMYIMPIINFGTTEIREWFEKNLDIVLPAMSTENLVTGELNLL